MDTESYREVSADYLQGTPNKRPQRAKFGPHRRPSGAEFYVRQFGGPVRSAFAPPLYLYSDGEIWHPGVSRPLLRGNIEPIDLSA